MKFPTKEGMYVLWGDQTIARSWWKLIIFDNWNLVNVSKFDVRQLAMLLHYERSLGKLCFPVIEVR